MTNEVLVFDRAFTETDRKQLYDYLATRYNIPHARRMYVLTRKRRRSATEGRRVVLGKPLQRGDKIIVLASDFDGTPIGCVQARTVHAHRGRVSARSIGLGQAIRGTLYRRDEGVTWARGWEGEDADTFKAQVALLVST